MDLLDQIRHAMSEIVAIYDDDSLENIARRIPETYISFRRCPMANASAHVDHRAVLIRINA